MHNSLKQSEGSTSICQILESHSNKLHTSTAYTLDKPLENSLKKYYRNSHEISVPKYDEMLESYKIQKEELDFISGYYMTLSYNYQKNLKLACLSINESERKFLAFAKQKNLTAQLSIQWEKEFKAFQLLKLKVKNFALEEFENLDLLLTKSQKMIIEKEAECFSLLGFTEAQFVSLLFQLVNRSIVTSIGNVCVEFENPEDYFIQILSVTIAYNQILVNIMEGTKTLNTNHDAYESFIINIFQFTIKYIKAKATKSGVQLIEMNDFMHLLETQIMMSNLNQRIDLDCVKFVLLII